MALVLGRLALGCTFRLCHEKVRFGGFSENCAADFVKVVFGLAHVVREFGSFSAFTVFL